MSRIVCFASLALAASVVASGCGGNGGSSGGFALTPPSASGNSTAPGSTAAPSSSSVGAKTPPASSPGKPAPQPPAPAPKPAPPPPPPAPAPPPPAGSGAHAKGIDVSVYQGTIDWAQVAASGIEFAIARVSHGTTLDTEFAKNWAGMKKHGLVRGAYHFFDPSGDAVKQAQTFLANVTFEPEDLYPVLDVEVTNGVTDKVLAQAIGTWVDEVKKTTGRVLIYTSPGFWNGHGLGSYAGTDLWVAHWFVAQPTIPHGWSKWKLWQYNDNAHVPGITQNVVDSDEFDGTLAELKTYASANPAPAPAPAPPPASPAAKPAMKTSLASSKNYTAGRGKKIDMIVIHDMEGTAPSAIAWFQNPAAQASAHFCIGYDGSITETVHEDDTAWHAGNWSVNQQSIGIEHAGYAAKNLYTADEYDASARLTAYLCTKYNIPIDRNHIIGHDEVPDPFHPGQFGGADHHTDPGPHWNWSNYMALVRHYANPPAPAPAPAP
jgi:GH25 family lysozyme M1 (1,4-beta-N-acetylmuramidase)